MIDTIAPAGWAVLAAAGILTGFSKTGLPGIGILAVPLTALALGGSTSVGVLLPMLIFGDLFAIVRYRSKVDRKRFLQLLPWALVGVVAGYFINRDLVTGDLSMSRFIGIVVIALLAINLLRKLLPDHDRRIPRTWVFAAVFGLLAGIVTMMANAAGPVMMIYLLAMDFDKNRFIGTGAAYFAFVNAFKVPFQIQLGNISTASLAVSAACFPAVLIGALAGLWAFDRIRPAAFIAAAEFLTLLAAVKLILADSTGWGALAELGVAALAALVVALAVRAIRSEPAAPPAAH